MASHQQLQTKVDSLSTQLQEWQQKAELWQTAEATRQTSLEEKEKRHDELLTALQSTLEALLTQHQLHTQQQAEQAAATQQQWQQAMEQHKADTTTVLTTQRDELLTSLANYKQDTTTVLSTQHDAHTTALAALDATVSQHSSSIAQLLPLDEEVGSIRTVLDAYNEDISGLVEREEATGGKVEALRVESERLLGMAGDVSGRCKRVESEVVEVRRAGVEQAAEWKAAWQKAEARVDDVSERLKEWTSSWVEERKAQQGAIQQLVSGQHGHAKQLEAVRSEVEQLRHSMQQRQHSATATASKQAEEQQDSGDMAAETKEANEDVDQADASSGAVGDDELTTTYSASSDIDSSSTASSFVPLSPTGRGASTSLSISSDNLLPSSTSNRSHSISLPTSPSDLSSVFPSVSFDRQSGVFTSPAKVVQSTQAMAWTINVKDGKSANAAVSSPPPRHGVAGSHTRDTAATPRSAVNTSIHRHSTSALTASAGKSSGGSGKGSVASSGRSSVSGSGVSSPNGRVSRQLASELDESGVSGYGSGVHSAVDVTVTADEQLDGASVGDDDDETY